jgi:site-specific DNA-methyltransferase (adenine-specific)
MKNFEYLRSLPDLAFDLVIDDPPYFEGPNKPGFYRNGKYSSTSAPAGDYDELKNWSVPEPEYFQELKRVSKHQIIWGANHFANRFDSHGASWIVWDKDNGASSFADAELAYSSFDKAVRIFKYRWNGMLQGYHGNKSKNEVRIHSTQKPVCLYEWLLSKYAEEGWRILDPHSGSGSSRIAAYNMGFDYVGIDLDQVMVNKSEKRFQQHISQGRLLFG